MPFTNHVPAIRPVAAAIRPAGKFTGSGGRAGHGKSKIFTRRVTKFYFYRRDVLCGDHLGDV